MHLDLTDEETTVLIRELTDITFGARYFLSPRIKSLEAILGKLRQAPACEPSPPAKHYESSSKGRYRRRR
jgi:hypothetical protein